LTDIKIRNNETNFEEVAMEINTQYYNYYNVPGVYTPDTPETPDYKIRYAVVDDRVESNNYSQDSDEYKAHVTLEEAYYAASVSNREKYSTVTDLEAALTIKYLNSDTYSGYSLEERAAMYSNELRMTLYGTISGSYDRNDPHLTGEVKAQTDEQVSAYNRKMVNLQLSNIFTNAGIDMSVLGNYQLSFSIDPYTYSLKVTGTDNSDLAQIIEKLLNENNNSRELYYYILQSSRGSISDDALLKYHTLRSFANVTGEDLRDYKLTEDGLVNEEGKNILDVYKEALKTSNAVPAAYKGDAYSNFADNITELLSKDYINIPDLILSIGYSNGMLQSLTNESVMQARFNVVV
jgi:hypothetical protein